MDCSIKRPALLLVDYYDSLIQEVDICAERLLETHSDHDLPIPVDSSATSSSYAKYCPIVEKAQETYDVEVYNNPYSYRYVYPTLDTSLTVPLTTVWQYVNTVRSKFIDEIKRIQSVNLQSFEAKRATIKSRQLSIEQLKCHLFAEKFCFLLHVDEFNQQPNNCLFKLSLIVTDFYLNSSDLDTLK